MKLFPDILPRYCAEQQPGKLANRLQHPSSYAEKKTYDLYPPRNILCPSPGTLRVNHSCLKMETRDQPLLKMVMRNHLRCAAHRAPGTWHMPLTAPSSSLSAGPENLPQLRLGDRLVLHEQRSRLFDPVGIVADDLLGVFEALPEQLVDLLVRLFVSGLA